MKTLAAGLAAHLASGVDDAVLVLAADAARRHAARLHRSRPRPRLRRHDVRGGGRLHRERDQGCGRPRRRQSRGRERAVLRPARRRPTSSPASTTTPRVEIFRVNWQSAGQARADARRHRSARCAAPASRSPPRCAASRTICSSRRAGSISIGCDADLGDTRCRVDLAAPALSRHRRDRHAARRAAPFTASGLGSFASGWFTRGSLRFTSRRQRRSRLRGQAPRRRDGRRSTIELWQEPAGALAAGDTFTITAGCDKQFATCRAKFANGANFRGFPHMPGNDFVTTVARPGSPATRAGELTT